MPVLYEAECGPKCRSRNHALDYVSAITKGTLNEVKAYSKLCYAAGQHCDIYGRSALHIAATCGKVDIIEWLLEERGGDLTLKDAESGWTALHRAMFHGQLASARLLIQFNSDLYTRDNEGLSPLDILMSDRPPHVCYAMSDQSEVYTWGDNTNLTLGHIHEQKRGHPEAIEFFRKANIYVSEVVLCKYHTVFLTRDGKVYTCGHGHGGRLGHGDEITYTVPKQIENLTSSKMVTQVSASRDHTAFLMDDGTVYTCGLNDSHQLGQFPTPQKCLYPRQVGGKNIKGKLFKGVSVGRFHTVLYTSDAVYTFGMNAGQLGHQKVKGTEKQTQPRQVSSLNHQDISIVTVSCSDAATVCLTTRGDIYVLHEYQCRKITSKWLDIQRIVVSGGHLDHRTDLDLLREKGGSELRIVFLNKGGKVFTWYEASSGLKRCRWAIRRQLEVKDIALCSSCIMFITDKGEAFTGNFVQKKTAKETRVQKNAETDDFEMRLIDLLLKEDTDDVMVRRVPDVHRANRIFIDPKGRNFATLQSLPSLCVTDVPEFTVSKIGSQFQQLLEEADEYDLIHDVILEVDGQTWPAHKYILLSRSDLFYKLIAESKKQTSKEKPTIIINDVHPEIFEQMLTFIYTDSCDLLKVGTKFELMESTHDKEISKESFEELDDDIFASSVKPVSAYEVTKRRKEKGKEKSAHRKVERNPVILLQNLAKKFEVKWLSKRLDKVKYVDGMIQWKNKQVNRHKIKFDRSKLKDLCDVSIKSEDGTVIQCHKCILVARLEYFHSMLGSGWIETSSSESLSLPVSGECLEILIDFLYTDEAVVIRDSENLELLCNVLVMADQMLAPRLVELCEDTLVKQVNMKNVGELLEFSFIYNAHQLKAYCQQFIMVNLPAIMEQRFLDMISDEVMADLTHYYHQEVPSMCRRILTPFSSGPSKSLLEELAEDCNQRNDHSVDNVLKKSKTKKRRSQIRSITEEDDKNMRDKETVRRQMDRQISISSDTSVRSEEEDINIPEMSTSPNQNVKPTRSSPRKPTSPIPIPSQKGASLSNITNSSTTTGSWSKSPTIASDGQISQSGSWKKSSATVTQAGSVGSPPQISLRDIMEEESSKNKPQTNTNRKKFSWKDVKKQQRMSSSSQPTKKDDCALIQVPTSPKPAWGAVNKVVKSFRDLMVEDKNNNTTEVSQPHDHHLANHNDIGKVAKQQDQHVSNHDRCGKQTVLSWGLPKKTAKQSNTEPVASPTSPRSIENPWSKVKVQSPTESSVSFTEIVKDEIQKHETRTRTTTKPLELIQIEEKAIQELLLFYKAGDNFDEHITVERIAQDVAAPLWKTK